MANSQVPIVQQNQIRQVLAGVHQGLAGVQQSLAALQQDLKAILQGLQGLLKGQEGLVQGHEELVQGQQELLQDQQSFLDQVAKRERRPEETFVRQAKKQYFRVHPQLPPFVLGKLEIGAVVPGCPCGGCSGGGLKMPSPAALLRRIGIIIGCGSGCARKKKVKTG